MNIFVGSAQKRKWKTKKAMRFFWTLEASCTSEADTPPRWYHNRTSQGCELS
jgi:hypothetical protein